MNILTFPGFIVLADRNTIMRAGERYKNTKGLIADLSRQECERTLAWICRRYSYGNPPEVAASWTFEPGCSAWRSIPISQHSERVLHDRHHGEI